MRVDAFIFDMDGVIVKSMPYHFKAVNQKLKEYGKEISHDFFEKECAGAKAIECIRKIFPDKDDEWRKNFVEEKQKLFRKIFVKSAKPNSGLLNLIKNLKDNNKKLLLATSSSKENAQTILKHINVYDDFDSITTGDEVEHAKPNPKIYIVAAKKLDLDPTTCIVIEDAVYGIIAAKKAGMTAVGITTNRKKETLLDAGADIVVDSLSDINLEKLEDDIDG